jgi:hypothetical protein
VHTQLGSANGGHVTARPGAKDDQIVTLGHDCVRSISGAKPVFVLGWLRGFSKAVSEGRSCLDERSSLRIERIAGWIASCPIKRVNYV